MKCKKIQDAFVGRLPAGGLEGLHMLLMLPLQATAYKNYRAANLRIVRRRMPHTPAVAGFDNSRVAGLADLQRLNSAFL